MCKIYVKMFVTTIFFDKIRIQCNTLICCIVYENEVLFLSSTLMSKEFMIYQAFGTSFAEMLRFIHHP